MNTISEVSAAIVGFTESITTSEGREDVLSVCKTTKAQLLLTPMELLGNAVRLGMFSNPDIEKPYGKHYPRWFRMWVLDIPAKVVLEAVTSLSKEDWAHSPEILPDVICTVSLMKLEMFHRQVPLDHESFNTLYEAEEWLEEARIRAIELGHFRENGLEGR